MEYKRTKNARKGWTNLHTAVYNNQAGTVEFLLKSGCDVGALSDNGETALHVAAVSVEHCEIARTLLEHCSRDQVRRLIDARTHDDGSSALHVAAKNGAFPVVWLLLSQGANFEIRNYDSQRPIDVAKDSLSKSLLHTVELDSRFAELAFRSLPSRLVTRLVLEIEASLHARNMSGMTILQLAVINDDVDAIEKIVELRLRKKRLPLEILGVPDRLRSYCENVKNWTKRLSELCHEDVYLEAHMALDAGTRLLTSVLQVVGLFDGELEHFAVIEETLQALQFDGTSVDVNSRFYEKLYTERKTDLYKFVDILTLTVVAPIASLLKSICSIHLGASSSQNDLTSFERCLLGNPDLNVRDVNGWTPLHHAIHHNNEMMVRMLLEHERKANATLATKKNKKTPLHMAVKSGNIIIVELILKHANVEGYVDKRTKPKGLTALHFAATIGRLDIVKCLLRKGANYRATSRKGKLPVDLAEDAKVIKFLKLVDELFAMARNGDASIVHKLTSLKRDELLSIKSARDGTCSWLEIVNSKCKVSVYAQIVQIIPW